MVLFLKLHTPMAVPMKKHWPHSWPYSTHAVSLGGGPYCSPHFTEGNIEAQSSEVSVQDHPVREKAEVRLEPSWVT